MTSFFALTEEILSQSSATWFSPQGGHLLYATFNATNVGEVSFKIYEGEGYNQGEPSVYGTDKSLRYPKVCKIQVNALENLTSFLLCYRREPEIPPSN